jgi:hypothetical protein
MQMANGQVEIAPRYQVPLYIEISTNECGTSGEQLCVVKASNDRLQSWIDAGEILKRADIRSLGRTDCRQDIRDSKTRFQRMSVSDIIAGVSAAKYDEMQKDTKSNLEVRMLTMLQTSDGLGGGGRPSTAGL